MYIFLVFILSCTCVSLAEEPVTRESLEQEYRALQEEIASRKKSYYVDQFYEYYHSYEVDWTFIQSLSIMALSIGMLAFINQLRTMRYQLVNELAYVSKLENVNAEVIEMAQKYQNSLGELSHDYKIIALDLAKAFRTNQEVHNQLTYLVQQLCLDKPNAEQLYIGRQPVRASPRSVIPSRLMGFLMYGGQVIAYLSIAWGSYDIAHKLWQYYKWYQKLKPLEERLKFLRWCLNKLKKRSGISSNNQTDTHAPLPDQPFMNKSTTSSHLVLKNGEEYNNFSLDEDQLGNGKLLSKEMNLVFMQPPHIVSENGTRAQEKTNFFDRCDFQKQESALTPYQARKNPKIYRSILFRHAHEKLLNKPIHSAYNDSIRVPALPFHSYEEPGFPGKAFFKPSVMDRVPLARENSGKVAVIFVWFNRIWLPVVAEPPLGKLDLNRNSLLLLDNNALQPLVEYKDPQLLQENDQQELLYPVILWEKQLQVFSGYCAYDAEQIAASDALQAYQQNFTSWYKGDRGCIPRVLDISDAKNVNDHLSGYPVPGNPEELLQKMLEVVLADEHEVMQPYQKTITESVIQQVPGLFISFADFLVHVPVDDQNAGFPVGSISQPFLYEKNDSPTRESRSDGAIPPLQNMTHEYPGDHFVHDRIDQLSIPLLPQSSPDIDEEELSTHTQEHSTKKPIRNRMPKHKQARMEEPIKEHQEDSLHTSARFLDKGAPTLSDPKNETVPWLSRGARPMAFHKETIHQSQRSTRVQPINRLFSADTYPWISNPSLSRSVPYQIKSNVTTEQAYTPAQSVEPSKEAVEAVGLPGKHDMPLELKKEEERSITNEKPPEKEEEPVFYTRRVLKPVMIYEQQEPTTSARKRISFTRLTSVLAMLCMFVIWRKGSPRLFKFPKALSVYLRKIINFTFARPRANLALDANMLAI